MFRSWMIIALSALTASQVFAAGGVDGGGGKSVVCRNRGGDVVSAEVLDLFEGREMFGLNIPTSSERMEAQIRYALEVLPPSSRGLVEFYVKSVLENMRLVSADLLPIDDSFEVMVPQGCKAEQLANYYSDDKIFINGPIWKMLTETGRAAIIVHEAVYAANRAVGATNSRQSRYVVAHLFASDTKLTDIKDRLPENALTCVGSKAPLFVWAFKNDGEWTLQFQILGGAYVVSKKTFTVSDEDFDLMEAKTFPVIPGEEMIGTSSEEVGSVESDFESKDIMTIRKTWEPIKTSDGKVIKGLQTPRYYLSWRSGTHPKTEVRDQMLNCSVGMP